MGTFYVAVKKDEYTEVIASGMSEDAARTLVEQIEKALMFVCIELMFGQDSVVVGYWDE